MSNSRYVLVLAGGSGERFWPLSRRAKPKQLLKLLGDQSLLEDTLARLDGFVPPERVLILTNRDQEAAVRALLPHLPAENIVAEPAKRDTAAAVALAVGWVARRDPGATMLVLAADHVIRDTATFQRDLAAAAAAAEQTGALVTIGIKPTWACPGARENIVFSDRPGAITLLGVSDLIVVQTADALLVCHRHEAERIKQLTAKVAVELQ